MTSEIQWKQSRTKCFQLSDLERDDVKWDISWYPRINKSIPMLVAKNGIYCKGIMLETYEVGLGAGEHGRRCLQAGVLWGVNESFLIPGANFNWIHKNEAKMTFSLWCHLEMNYRPNESPEVKLIEELNSPLIYYRTSIGIVMLRPVCSSLGFDSILMLINWVSFFVYFVGFFCVYFVGFFLCVVFFFNSSFPFLAC